MAFVRGAWKLLVAVKDLLVLLLLLLFFAALYGLLSARPNVVAIGDGALNLKLEGVVVEQPAVQDFFSQLTANANPVREYRARDIVQAIRAAKDDSRVKAIVLDLDRFMGGGQTNLADIGAALDEFRASKKPVYAFASFYGDAAYQLAAHASEIWVDPMGGVAFAGPGGSRLYYREALDRFGVTAHIYRVGTYKSAVEPYLRADQSSESKEAANALNGALWQQWLANVTKARPSANVTAMANNPAALTKGAAGNLVTVAQQLKLVDKVGDKIAFRRHVAKVAGVDESAAPDSYKAIDFDAWVAANPVARSGAPIGVVTVAGTILSGEDGPGTAASGRIADEIYKALDNDDLKALVVRIDSPGGSAFASEEMRLALLDAKRRKLPVVVSMGNVAASGGYWVASAGDAIFAEPDTITGSIGVFAVIPSFEQALAKWGVKADGVTTTALSGQPDLLGGFNESFDTIAQSGVENSYAQFLNLVAKSRGKTPQQVDAIAQGRVWDGGTARQLGLVDRFGGLDDAVAEAAKRAGLKAGEYHPRYLDRPVTFANFLFGRFGASEEEERGSGLFGWAAAQQRLQLQSALTTAQMLLEQEGVQAWCLDCQLPSARTNSAAPSSWYGLMQHYLGAGAAARR
ncbi:MAG: signal peptide peptidase SppA [Parasphingorhabdus sp.]|nr:signal peptide peptidase SppA [Parasphingorhabdus sp.]